MTQLRVETFRMPAAKLGGENPFPISSIHVPVEFEAPDADNTDFPDRGFENSMLPYRVQDQYDRNKQPRDFKVGVLENDILRATVLLELGGRLWSLYHKPRQQELLYVNPVFQPANFAIRNAWFCGGVEWNIGVKGHCPLTCEPVFAAKVLDSEGVPFLRLYEFERARAIPFQIDLVLRPGDEFLRVFVRMINTNDFNIPMYWWSNAAVEEGPDKRVLAPADESFGHDYSNGKLTRDPLPIQNKEDVSYPQRRQFAGDKYFNVKGRRPWVTALDPAGRGMIETSTDRLRGRKCFIYGMSQGGRRWQEYEAAPGCAYIEIQAGLSQVQGQYLVMKPHEQWSFMEAFGLMEANPKIARGNDWKAAYQHVDEKLEALLPRQALQREYEAHLDNNADSPPAEILHHGSGWGALEELRRQSAGQSPLAPPAMSFPLESLGAEQQPWLSLLHTGQLPERSPDDGPGAFMVQSGWRQLLEASISAGKSDHWLAWYHLAVMRERAGDKAGCKTAMEESLRRTRTGWALRQMALFEYEGHKNADKYLELLHQAIEADRNCLPLLIEYSRALINAGRAKEQLAFAATLLPEIAEEEHILMHRACSALELGDLDFVEDYLNRAMVHEPVNVREGDGSLADLWAGLHARRTAAARGVKMTEALLAETYKENPPPAKLDFRMSVRHHLKRRRLFGSRV